MANRSNSGNYQYLFQLTHESLPDGSVMSGTWDAETILTPGDKERAFKGNLFNHQLSPAPKDQGVVLETFRRELKAELIGGALLENDDGLGYIPLVSCEAYWVPAALSLGIVYAPDILSKQAKQEGKIDLEECLCIAITVAHRWQRLIWKLSERRPTGFILRTVLDHFVVRIPPEFNYLAVRSGRRYSSPTPDHLREYT